MKNYLVKDTKDLFFWLKIPDSVTTVFAQKNVETPSRAMVCGLAAVSPSSSPC